MFFYIKIPWLILKIFFKGIIYSVLGVSSPELSCYQNLLGNHSFRLSGISSKKWRNLITFYGSAFRYIFIQQARSESKRTLNSIAILHDSPHLFDLNKEHVGGIIKNEVSVHLFKSIPPFGFSFRFKLFLLTNLFILTPLVLFHWFFLFKRRNVVGLIFLCIPEWISIVRFLTSCHVKEVYYFGSFENDANFLSLLLMNFQINTIYMISPNPLAPFYCKVVADRVFFSLPYQEEESRKYARDWFINGFQHTPIFGYKSLVNSIQHSNPEFKIGFLSGGSFVRKNWEGRYYDDGIYKSEYAILKILDNMDDIFFDKICIYLHPHEKNKSENEMLYSYEKLIKNKKIVFVNLNQSSYKVFYKTDLCISVYSSSAHERLFMGYKTLLAPLYINYKYYEGLSIEKIVSYDELNLIDNIRKSLNFSREEFFKYYNQENCTYKNYLQYIS